MKTKKYFTVMILQTILHYQIHNKLYAFGVIKINCFMNLWKCDRILGRNVNEFMIGINNI
jgi:hypothetical protein